MPDVTPRPPDLPDCGWADSVPITAAASNYLPYPVTSPRNLSTPRVGLPIDLRRIAFSCGQKAQLEISACLRWVLTHPTYLFLVFR